MEDKIIHIEKNEKLIKEHPTLACRFSIADYYPEENYMSIKCEKLGGSCTYKSAKSNDYEGCIILKRAAN